MWISLLAAMLVAAPQAGEGVEGRWKTQTRNAIVEIQRCGASICGRLLTSDALRTNPDLRDTRNSNAQLRTRPLKGMQILSGFTADGGNWSGGKIYNAEDGKTYTADITLAGADQLKLRGCVFKPFCRTQTWTRVR
ncbi:DUF2147 domain-containing protein [Sphingomonas sp. ABOLE]|uniref:DUF2147 domain-containing protein n=1 Tax=Sphingomonas sp. ABOLE TaxID=1985878 RepID=UPI000F7FA537|nr:DUF2147 domain-containing protein [Sphingomonas sp. ABOLE]RSV43487.1 DUF2147 domain-containing protein [Sphingomonas sp. ABOLE]